MNMKELANAVAARTGIQKGDSAQITGAVFEIITETLASGEPVNATGFGKWDTKQKPAGTALNPKLLKDLRSQGVPDEEAKERAKVATEAKVKVTFKTLKGLEDALNA